MSFSSAFFILHKSSGVVYRRFLLVIFPLCIAGSCSLSQFQAFFFFFFNSVSQAKMATTMIMPDLPPPYTPRKVSPLPKYAFLNIPCVQSRNRSLSLRSKNRDAASSEGGGSSIKHKFGLGSMRASTKPELSKRLFRLWVCLNIHILCFGYCNLLTRLESNLRIMSSTPTTNLVASKFRLPANYQTGVKLPTMMVSAISVTKSEFSFPSLVRLKFDMGTT